MTLPHPYGITAQFDDAGSLLEAARAAREAGYRRFEGYSPYPLKELDEIIPNWDLVSVIALVAGVCGGFIGFYMQFFIAVDVYPTNIGGRPLNSWPAFVVITFAVATLFAVAAIFFATLFFEGFPALYHPLFRVAPFRQASADGYFLCIEARDGKFHPVHTAQFVESLNPVRVWEVDRE